MNLKNRLKKWTLTRLLAKGYVILMVNNSCTRLNQNAVDTKPVQFQSLPEFESPVTAPGSQSNFLHALGPSRKPHLPSILQFAPLSGNDDRNNGSPIPPLSAANNVLTESIRFQPLKMIESDTLPTITPPFLEQGITEFKDTCGISRGLINRVVGGAVAKQGTYPWVAALGYRDGGGEVLRFFCAGSLITLKYIVTSAHCINQNLTIARLGAHDLMKVFESTARDYRIKTTKIHDNFDLVTVANDVAVIELTAEADLSGNELQLSNKGERTCGITRPPQSRIVGGRETHLGSHPYMVALKYWIAWSFEIGCGACLISSTFVLTAAHCVADTLETSYFKPRLWAVRVGACDIESPFETIIEYGVKQAFMHPKFNRRFLKNDIALIKTRRSIIFNAQVSPICLPTDAAFFNQDFVGTRAIVLGWGRTHYGGPRSRVLKAAPVPIVDVQKCRKSYSSAFKGLDLNDGIMCAGDGSADACQSDSGGPLILQVFCYTPRGEVGVCTSLKYCPEIVNLFARVHPNVAKRYSMESQHVCGNQVTPDQYPLVCCTIIVKGNNNDDLSVTTPATTTTTATSTTTSTTTTTKKPKNDNSSRSIANETYTTCDTPDFQSGFCKPLENCPELFDKLRRNSGDEEFKKYLRLSHNLCGEEKTIVCCPEINIRNILNDRSSNASQRYNKLPSEEEGCGLVNLSTTKIVDGDDSEIGAWPWMALIGYDPWSVRPFRCGGTLVSGQHVITAAHCIRHDFHLRSKSYVNTMPYVAGWGYTSQGGATSPILKQVQLPVLNNEVCRRIYTTLMPHLSAQEYDESVICAGFVVGGKDTCKGDSGGPLMIPELYKGITRYYLIGVVSYGHGCGQAPGIYISTQYWMDWIIEQISTM
uniref:Lectizyme n=1 Tax=Glossina pallidipes TaxID=7398 RepID=A0A1A9ZBU3_GLOPL